MKCYLLPGLGFDHRCFRKLELTDSTPLDWRDPLAGESVVDYAHRVAESIEESEDTVLIGHSFGGMLAQEIAAFKPVQKIILISSVRYRKELPLSIRMIKPLGLHRLFSRGLVLRTFRFWGRWHDFETKEEQTLFREMVGNQSNRSLQWALRQLSAWQDPTLPEQTRIFQIHGARDRTLPISKLTAPDRVIENAGHFMVYRHADLISKIIRQELES